MSPKKVCVFDFDQTLAADEVTFLLDRASMVDRGFGGPERISMLRAMLTALTEHKVVLAVCSLNSRDVIRLALTSVGLSDFFEPTMIFDRSDYVRCGSLKSQVILRAILPKVLMSSQANTLFVDDDPAHIKDATLRLRAATTILVPRPPMSKLGAAPRQSLPGGGIRQPQCELIIKWASESNSAQSKNETVTLNGRA